MELLLAVRRGACPSRCAAGKSRTVAVNSGILFSGGVGDLLFLLGTVSSGSQRGGFGLAWYFRANGLKGLMAEHAALFDAQCRQAEHSNFIQMVKVCVCVCVHACLYMYVYIYIHTQVATCIYVCMYACMYVCMHACMYVSIHIYIYALYIYVCICISEAIRTASSKDRSPEGSGCAASVWPEERRGGSRFLVLYSAVSTPIQNCLQVYGASGPRRKSLDKMGDLPQSLHASDQQQIHNVTV